MRGRIHWAAWVFIILGMSGLSQGAAATTQTSPGFGAEKSRLVERPGEIVSTLENGLTVIVKRVPGPALSVRGYVATGGLFEGKWLGGGLSHLLEHLVAGGSSERRSEAENRTLLQKIGNNSNAYTSDDHTAYFVNTTPEHLEQAVDLVSGWMLGAKITPDEFHRERQVVQRELEMDEGEPDRVFWELSSLNRYRLSPARVPVIGYQPVIQTMTRDDVYAYYKMAYEPNNMVFAVAGDLDPETMLRAVQRFVADVPPGRAFSHDITPEPPVQSPRRMVATFPKLGQARLQLAFPTIKLSSPELYALDLLSSVLSDGESSLLVENLRDKLHLVSGISSYSMTPAYVPGSFAVTMHLNPDKIQEATKAVLALLDQVKREGIPADRLQRAKVQMKMDRLRGMQTAEQIASSMAGDYLSTGDPHFTDRYLARIEKLTPQQLQAVANKYFDTQKLLTTVLLPREQVSTLPKAEDLIRAAAPTTQTATAPATQAGITRIVLENNVVVLLKRTTTTPLVSVRMYALGGMTAESAGDNGIGNLAMEMLPRGTKTQSAEQIAQFFDSIGGQLDTACGNNTWYWNAGFLNSDFDKAMKVYADVVNHPAFAAEELSAMKPRILAAIASQDANWTSQAFRFFRQSYFGPLHSPYQFQAIGTAKNVNSFTPEQLHKWYEQTILRAPRVLAIFGDIDAAQAKAAAQKYFGGGEKLPLPGRMIHHGDTEGTEKAKNVAPAASVQVERVKVQKTAQPLAGVVLGFDSRSVIGDAHTPAITVADTMASGYEYPTGYLHEVLRGQGLVYVVQAFNWPGRDEKLPGTFAVYAGCDPHNVNKVVDLILENIARLQGTPNDMNESWFARSKQLITTADAIDNQTPDAQATTAALDELFGLGYDFHDGFAGRINAVSLDQVRAVSDSLLTRCTVTVSTPLPEAVDIQTGQRTYKSFPHIELAPKGVVHDAGKTP
jgi:zinc protease